MLLLIPFGSWAQTNYTWTGSGGTAWNNAANWTPNTGFPLAADNATIVNTANAPVLDMDRTVNNLTITSGTLNLNAFTLTYVGNGTFTAGAVNNGTLAPNSAAGTTTCSGTSFTANIAGSSSIIKLNGSVFNGTVQLTKTGASNDLSNGGNVFNNTVTFTVTNGRLYPFNNGVDTYNADVVLNSTGTSGGIWFGQTNGSATLANGRTITVGVGGFSIGSLLFRNFTQTGSTAQNLNLTGTATLYYQTGTTFNGAVTSVSPALYLNGSTFNANATFTKNGATNEYSSGGNIFNGTTEFIVTGTGTLNPDNTGADQFNGDLLVNSTNTGGIRFSNSTGTASLATGHTISVGTTGYTAGQLTLKNFTQTGSTAQTLNMGAGATLYIYAGSVFNGPITATAGGVLLTGATFNSTAKFTKTGTSNDYSGGGCRFNGTAEFINTNTGILIMNDAGLDAYASDILVSNTSTGQIRFGNGGGSATLASGHTISVGSLGFSTGALLLKNFTQSGATPQVLNLGSSAILYYNPGCVFNGSVTSTSGSLFITGSTFNSAGKFTKTGASGDGSNGGNIFNATVELINTNTGNIYMAEAGADQYNGDVLVENTSTGQIRFGNGGGSTTLASGHTITTGSLGFTGGLLLLKNFTQLGSTSQLLDMASTASLYLYPGNVFNGPLTTSSGSLYVQGSTFNATCKLIKIGTTNDGSTGGSTFNGDVEFVNANTGIIYMTQSGADAFNGNIVVNNLSTGQIQFGQGGGFGTLASGKTLSVGSGGFSAGVLMLRNFTQTGATAQNLVLGSTAQLNISSGNVFNGPLTSTSGALYINGSTFNAPCSFTKTGATGEGWSGGNIFNADMEIILASSGFIYLTQNGADTFNGNILVSNTNGGDLRFGNGGGSGTLAAGKTVSVGSLGYSAGLLLFRNFTQLGSTPQTLSLGTSALLYFYPGNVFNGPVTSTSGRLFLNGTTFNDVCSFTKTNASGDNSAGGNVFNANVEISTLASGNIYLAENNPDIYNGNIVVNNPGTANIRFGNSGAASSTLAAGRTITVGSGGFLGGILLLRNFIQVGNTPQSLTIDPSATLYFQSGDVFDGDVTSVSGGIYLNGATFNRTSKFTKTGTSGDVSNGGNTFNDRMEITLSNTGPVYLDQNAADVFNNDIVVNNLSTGYLTFGQATGSATLAAGHTITVGTGGFASGTLYLKNFTQLGTTPQNLVLGSTATLQYQAGSTFNGNITSTSGGLFFSGTTFNGTGKFTKNGTSGDGSAGGDVFNGATEFINTNTGNLSIDYTGIDAFNANVLLNNTSTGQINFGQNGGSATLATGLKIGVGSGGFSAGSLTLRNFTQLGATPQVLPLGSAASLSYNAGNTFNGDLTSSSGSLYITGSTFNGVVKMTKTGTSGDACAGNNTFNSTAEFINTNTGNLSLDYIGADLFNGNILVNNTSTGQINFGQNGGTATLANGFTISVGATGYSTGSLVVRNFTQLGATPQNIALGTAATLYYQAGNTFNANVTSTSGGLFFNGTVFNAAGKFTKTGTSGDGSSGGNTFNGTSEFIVSNTGNLSLDQTGVDAFNGNILVNSTSTGQINFGASTGSATLAAGRTMSLGALGFATGSLGIRNFTQVGGTAQSLMLGIGAQLFFQTGNTFNGNMTASAGNMYLNGSTFNGNGWFRKEGNGSNGCTGGNIFNGIAEIVNTSTAVLYLDNTLPDAFNANLLLNSKGTGGISFGNSTGSATLATGATLGIGSLGFTAGTISFRNFTQVGSTTHTLTGTGTSTLTFLSGTIFNGAVTTSSPNLYLSGSTFNGNAQFTKTGTVSNSSAGGNIFNGSLAVRVTSTGDEYLAVNAVDDINGNASFVRAAGGRLVVGYNYTTTFSKNVSTVGSAGTVEFGSGATARSKFDGTTTQQFSTDAAWPPAVKNLTLAMTSGGTLDLLGSITVTTDVAFTTGVVRPQAATSTSTGLLILNSGITISDAADNGSYVDGFVRKIGSTAFTFPVGNGGFFAPISMGAPGNAAYHFTARYQHQDTDPPYSHTAKDVTLDHVSRCEYWILDRTNGSANVSVTLSWDSLRSCGVTNIAQLAVARWTGSLWKNVGNGGTTGNTANGTVATSGAVSTFASPSPFTLASTTANNPLPIELLSFTAERSGSEVRTEWVTATEHDNARFEVQRSADGNAFELVGTLPGAGDSQSELQYTLSDPRPLSGVSYYRLKQVDYDGMFTYSAVVPVYFGTASATGMSIFPNPTSITSNVSISSAKDGYLSVLVMDAQGRQVSDLSRTVEAGSVVIPFSLEELPAGIYLVRMQQGDDNIQEARVIKE